MKRKVQGRNEILITATPAEVFAVLEDTARVPEYMHAVKHVDAAGGRREQVGASRRCQVELEGKQGEVVERCIELEQNTRISFLVERDTFGFSKMFEDFGFSFLLHPTDNGHTQVTIEGFYREKNLLARLMNALLMRRKLHQLRAGILTQLKVTVERSHALSPIPESPLIGTG